jgi:hypothetical protein
MEIVCVMTFWKALVACRPASLKFTEASDDPTSELILLSIYSD